VPCSPLVAGRHRLKIQPAIVTTGDCLWFQRKKGGHRIPKGCEYHAMNPVDDGRQKPREDWLGP
jgi:hypothetical protein